MNQYFGNIRKDKEKKYKEQKKRIELFYEKIKLKSIGQDYEDCYY